MLLLTFPTIISKPFYCFTDALSVWMNRCVDRK